MKKVLFKNILPVDSGSMAIMAEDFLAEWGGDKPKPSLFAKVVIEKDMLVEFKVDAYTVDKRQIKLRAGTYIVSDPCYWVKNDKWMPLLEKTNYLKINNVSGLYALENFGGDGVHEVTITEI